MTNSAADRVWFRIMRLHMRAYGEINERLRAIGLSVPQCDVLTTLSEKEGMTQQELAQRLYVTKGNISGLIDRLAKAGLVERRVSRIDKRSHALFLTPEGRELAGQGIELQKCFVSETFGQLSPPALEQLEEGLVCARDEMRKLREAKSKKTQS